MIKPIQALDRTQYIGGSDAAGVLGLSRWNTPLSIFAEKKGLIKPQEEDTLAQWLGKELEDVVARRFTKENGKTVRKNGKTLFHPKYPFIAANIDRLVDGEDAGLECKTCSAWKAKEWDEEEIPREYIIQCLHYLMVTGKQRWYLAVLIGNQDFQIKVIDRDEAILADMLKREVEFWTKYVVPDVMPEMITKYDADTLSKLYPQAINEVEIDLPDEANRIIEFLDSFNADAKNLDGLIAKHKNQLKAMLKNSAVGRTLSHRISWKNYQSSCLDSEALKKEKPAIYEKYLRNKSTRRFTYKKIGD